MTKLNEIYKCNVCGNIVEMTHTGVGTLVCCGQNMQLQVEFTSENEGVEKHVPVVEEVGGKLKVKVGSIPHPMEEEHYIEWVELVTPERSYMSFLKPGDAPEVEFCFIPEEYTVREYCNLHGLWKA